MAYASTMTFTGIYRLLLGPISRLPNNRVAAVSCLAWIQYLLAQEVEVEDLLSDLPHRRRNCRHVPDDDVM